MTLPAVGIDIESVARFADRTPHWFTPAELEHCAGRPERLAGVWCAKEAVVKAVAKWAPLHVRDVEVGYNGDRPEVRLAGYEVDVSISHTTEYATAMAIVRPVTH